MKHYDSYLLFGTHLSERIVGLILKNSSLNFFNSKIKTYGCEIVKLNVIMTDELQQSNYFLRISGDLSSNNLIRNEDLRELLNQEKIDNFKKLLDDLSQPVIEPYLMSVPIVREL